MSELPPYICLFCGMVIKDPGKYLRHEAKCAKKARMGN